jgi:diguanylate cyclase (GGDEF)-like protein/PAS domain S-box-containing protein
VRVLADVVAAGVDVFGSEDRLLCVAVDAVTAAVGERSLIWLASPGAGGVPVTASSHAAAVEAAIEDAAVCWGLGESALVVSADEERADWLRAHDLAQVAYLPMLAYGWQLGTLAVTRAAERGPFDEEELAFLGALADVTAVALYNARVVSDSAAAVEELRRQADLMDHISDAMIACDLSHEIVNWNAGAERIYGYTPSEVLGVPLFALLATAFTGPDGAPVDADEVMAQLARTGSWYGELRERRADGAPLVILSSITTRTEVDGSPCGLVVVNRDVTAQRREEHRALHDALTGLPNRRMLNGRLYEAFARACRSKYSIAVFFIDLDGFKPINDTHGHTAGDEVLRATAERLSATVRTSDTVGRLGGDEFLVILEKAGTVDNVTQVAHRIIEAVAEPIEVPGTTVSVRPSIGIALTEQPDASGSAPDRMLDAADKAMYVAKRERRGLAFAPLM